MKVELKEGAPPGTEFFCHPSGWMQADIFSHWFDHFLKYAKPSKEDPVLLILDGHTTHTRNLDLIEIARNSQTTIVCLPPHCSHKLQPLDVSFMAPFNTYYIQAIEKFLRNNPGRLVTQYQVSRLLGEAFLKAATPTVAVNGFRRCGIVPINRAVFTEVDFAAAATTDIADPSAACPSSKDHQKSQTPCQEEIPSDCSRPSTSSAVSTLSMPSRPTSFAASPLDIAPIPKAKICKRRSKRKKGSAAILTSSPYKTGLVTETEEREEKARLEKMKLELKKEKKDQKKKGVKEES